MRMAFLLLIPIMLMLLGFVSYKVSKVPVVPVHYHANFAVFIDGTQVDFSKPELMHIKPCTNDEVESNDPEENVHLHDQVGNVVHVHADGISWNLFFSTIHFDIAKKSEGKTLLVYENGKIVDQSLLDQPIRKQDRVLIEIASQSGNIDSEYEKVGSNAEDYDAGKVGAEKCGVTGNRTLLQRFKLAFGL